MSVIQEHPAELNYVNAWIGPLAQRPALLILMDKYPAPVERLAAEVRDNPCPTS